MKKTAWIILSFLILISCQDVERTPKPDNLISENKMVDVLTEISLLHGARSYNKNMLEEKGIAPYPYLMEKYGIDSVQLVQSNNYYAENYKEYNRIYEKVKLKLEILLKKYDSIREVEERERDSLIALERDSLKVGLDSLKQDSLKVELDSLKQDSLNLQLPQPVSRKLNSFRKLDSVSRSVIR